MPPVPSSSSSRLPPGATGAAPASVIAAAAAAVDLSVADLAAVAPTEADEDEEGGVGEPAVTAPRIFAVGLDHSDRIACPQQEATLAEAALAAGAVPPLPVLAPLFCITLSAPKGVIAAAAAATSPSSHELSATLTAPVRPPQDSIVAAAKDLAALPLLRRVRLPLSSHSPRNSAYSFVELEVGRPNEKSEPERKPERALRVGQRNF